MISTINGGHPYIILNGFVFHNGTWVCSSGGCYTKACSVPFDIATVWGIQISENFDAIGHWWRRCKKKHPCSTTLCALPGAWIKGFRPEVKFHTQITLEKNYLFLKNYVTSEEAVSHNVLYYQQPSFLVTMFGAYQLCQLRVIYHVSLNSLILWRTFCWKWAELLFWFTVLLTKLTHKQRIQNDDKHVNQYISDVYILLPYPMFVTPKTICKLFSSYSCWISLLITCCTGRISVHSFDFKMFRLIVLSCVLFFTLFHGSYSLTLDQDHVCNRTSL